jgi:chromosome partitioning protein
VAAKVFAIANQKGGVGKTTTALTLGAALVRMGHKVLIMDLDPHASATIHMALYPENLEYTVRDIFRQSEVDVSIWQRMIQPVKSTGFDLVPSHIRLSELEVDLKDVPGKGLILNKAMKKIRDRYDYILLDCPPHMGIILVNSLVAADCLIIPIQTDFLALHGLRLIFDTLRIVNRVVASPVQFRALATMYDQRAGACRRVLNFLRQKLGNKLFSTVIPMDTKFREASGQGKVIFDLSTDSKGAMGYTQLAKEISQL